MWFYILFALSSIFSYKFSQLNSKSCHVVPPVTIHILRLLKLNHQNAAYFFHHVYHLFDITLKPHLNPVQHSFV